MTSSSHTPAFGTLDMTDRGGPAGCERLADRLRQLDGAGAGPRLHVHGDIHEAADVHATSLGAGGRTTVNASVLDLRYRLAHPPVVVDLSGQTRAGARRAL